MNQSLRIGEVASQAGVNIQTLRYYERRGLLKDPPRHYTGERRYPPETVALIRAIKRAQGLGFTLEEIESLLVADGRRGADLTIATSAAEKMRELDQRILDLQRTRQRLEAVVSRGCDSITRCTCGQCPLDDDVPREEVRPSVEGDAPPEPAKANLVAARRWLPVSALALVACLACLFPALAVGAAGLFGLGVVGAGEGIDLALAAGAGLAAGVAATSIAGGRLLPQCEGGCGRRQS